MIIIRLQGQPRDFITEELAFSSGVYRDQRMYVPMSPSTSQAPGRPRPRVIDYIRKKIELVQDHPKEPSHMVCQDTTFTAGLAKSEEMITILPVIDVTGNANHVLTLIFGRPTV